jgi:outer membrane protein assembly factor BamB
MSASQFIDLLEEQGLLDPQVIADLRKSIVDAKARITAESLSKNLVENGHLTRFQATQLVSKLQERLQRPPSPAPNRPAEDLPQSAPPVELGLEEIMLLEEPGDPVPPVLEARLVEDPTIPGDASEEIFDIDTLPGSPPSPPGPTIASSYSDPIKATTPFKPVKVSATGKDSWDSFRIWGVGFFLSVLLVMLTWLVYWLMSGSASEFYTLAQEAYESRDYEVALEKFRSFAKSYPKEEKASAAKVFAAIAEIRQANDQLGDPARAIDTSATVLPTVVNEPAMSDSGIRADLASTLVSVAEKMVQRADSAKTTEERKKHIEKLDEQVVLMRNPQYIPNANRITNESRIKTIDEERARILRDIQRAEDLVAAVSKMQEAVKNVDVEAAYQARRGVVRKYPQLETDPQLLDWMHQATEIQRQLVKSAERIPQPVETSVTSAQAMQLLLYKQARSKPTTAEEPSTLDPDTAIFVKAKQSIYGLRAIDGQVLWRRYVGLEGISDPLRISSDPRSDCLIVIPSRNVLAKLSGEDGSSLWELDFGARILPPAIDGPTVFVATADGRVTAVDIDTGQTKWSKQLPQAIATGVGGAVNKPPRYVVGEHSNIYVLSKGDGGCQEVFYFGHAAGTIAVPPLNTLGHLLIFHNLAVGACKIHVFKTNEEGTQLERCQEPINLKGHVIVSPTIEGRRLVVVTDLGETIAFDVEPASSKDKLNRVAGLNANEIKPRTAWPLVAGNELWIASNRFAKFEIQVVGQKLVPKWVVEDEDQFVGRPIKYENRIFHARIVRGTEGVRVASMNAETGEAWWEVDLGVPLVGIHPNPGAGIAVVNSQAALFQVDGAALTSGKPLTAKENPGRNQRAIQFANPLFLADGRVVYLNAGFGNQIAIYDAKAVAGNTLLVNALQVGSGQPSGEAVAAPPGIIVPLSNGQLVSIDPASGKQLSSPFQPTLDSVDTTRWLTPVLLPDRQSMVSATNQKALYRLTVGSQLKELSQTPTESVWVQRLAAIEDTICGVARGQAQDSLEFYRGQDLTRIDGVSIDGRITWGPYAINQHLLAYSETSGLMAFDAQGRLQWKAALGPLSLVGNPLQADDDYLLADRAGRLLRLAATTGTIQATIRVGEPLAGGPILFGSGLLLPGAEGVLLALRMNQTLPPEAK